jgi:hypothetical protein
VIKARRGEDLIFGLSRQNVALLMQGQPIAVDLSELGLSTGRVVIFYGATEEDMEAQLEAAGLLPPA